MNKKILFINSNTHHLFGQQHLIVHFLTANYDVVLLTPDEGNYFNKLKDRGYNCIHLEMNSKSMNPVDNIKLIFLLRKHFKEIKPDIIASFTIKPNLFASTANRFVNIPIIANVTGLGYVFIKGGLISRIAVLLYQFAFKNCTHVFFQNEDDFNYFKRLHLIRNLDCADVLPGSGVNLDKFRYKEMVYKTEVKFLFSGRLLWDKGIKELISAFRVVKIKYPESKLILIGSYFFDNPAAISQHEIEGWIREGLLDYHGMVDNVLDYYTDCDCVILPSYREGMPRSLLEASSVGRPIITVDSVGCKDVVEDGVTGFLAMVKDVDSLAEAMIKFIELPFDKKIAMGKAGRTKMENEFDQKIVVNKYVEVVNRLLNN